MLSLRFKVLSFFFLKQIMPVKIACKCICFRVRDDLEWETCMRNIDTLASISGVTDVCAVPYKKMIIVDGVKKIQLANGMDTVRLKLCLSQEPLRVHIERPAPKSLLDKLISEGFEEWDFRQIVGEKIVKYVQNATARGQTEIKRTEAISKCSSGLEAARRGLIKHNEQITTQANIEFAKKRKIVDMRESLPKLDGSLVLKFYHRIEGEINTENPRETTVTICGIPNDLKTKCKHYWIYSKEAGYGKTYTILNEIYKKYSSDVVGDPKNFCGVSENVQFLIFDEYSINKKLNFEDLKSLASQDSSMAKINRKSHGESYKPAEDVQVIILSNYSPYEVYGTYNHKENNRIIDKDALSALEQRFLIHRLDGADEEEKRKHLSVSTWSENEFKTEIALKRKQMMKGENKMVETENFLKKLVSMYRAREGDTGVSLAGLSKYVSDPVDWIQAQTMYSESLKLLPEEKRKENFEAKKSGTFELHKMCVLDEIQTALEEKCLFTPQVFDYLDLDLSDFTCDFFKDACIQKLPIVDSDELLPLLLCSSEGIKRKKKCISHDEDSSSEDDEEIKKNNKRQSETDQCLFSPSKRPKIC